MSTLLPPDLLESAYRLGHRLVGRRGSRPPAATAIEDVGESPESPPGIRLAPRMRRAAPPYEPPAGADPSNRHSADADVSTSRVISARAEAARLDSLIDSAYRCSIELRLAAARLVAAVVLAIVMELGSGPFHPPAVTLLTIGYGAYSAGVLALVWKCPTGTTPATLTLHAIDLAWVTVATALSGGASSHTFVLFLLVLAAAAYRWSLPGSLYTGATVVVIVSLESLAAARGYVSWPFEFDTFVLLTSYVAVFAVLFGLLSERLHAHGAQAITLGEVLTGVGRASGITGALRETLGRLVELFGAREAMLVAREFEREACFLWRARSNPRDGVELTRAELSRAERDAFFFAAPADALTIEVRRASGNGVLPHARILNANGEIVSRSLPVPPDLAGLSAWRSMVIGMSDVHGCWHGRLFLLDATRPRNVALRLALLRKLIEQVTPAFTSLYLMRRLRSRAEATERARLCRELHDGIVQTLSVLQIRLNLAARRIATADPALSNELEDTRELVRADVMNLRELIEQIRPTDIDAARLPTGLRDLVERFSRTSGIDVRLMWTADSVDLTRRQCQEVLRIVQEALVNVRRHSGASRAVVRVGADVSDWEVIVEDNGAGFGFEGRATHGELRQRHLGPRVIRERVESLDGSLTVESSSSGSRLEIVFPRVHLHE